MKKLLCLIMCAVICFNFASCSEPAAPEKITLTKDNVLDYVFIDVYFGEVNVYENETFTYRGKYYLTCVATISVKPKGDFRFEDASLACNVETDNWLPSYSAADSYNYTIMLDKDGYGEKSIFVYGYSDMYQLLHPSRVAWDLFPYKANGTVIKLIQ